MKKRSGHPGIQLLESQIRYACQNTTSNLEAAKWLHVDPGTWKKYASLYIDEATGLNLYELHKQTGRQRKLIIPKSKLRSTKQWTYIPWEKAEMTDIFAGKYPKYNITRLKQRLIYEGWKKECCELCGFEGRRQTDWEMPLQIHFLDGCKTNKTLENMQLLCLNCFFIHVGNPLTRQKKLIIDEETLEIRPANKQYLRDRMQMRGYNVFDAKFDKDKSVLNLSEEWRNTETDLENLPGESI